MCLLFLVDLRVYSFTLILSVDFLKTLAEFFSPNISSSQTESEVRIKSESAAKILQSKTSDSRGPSMYNIEKPEKVAEVRSSAMMTINLKVEQPDIVLVEHMDNIDTRALILNVSRIKFNFINSALLVFFYNNYFSVKFLQKCAWQVTIK